MCLILTQLHILVQNVSILCLSDFISSHFPARIMSALLLALFKIFTEMHILTLKCFLFLRQRFLPSRRIFWQGLCLLCPPSVDPVPRFPLDRRRGLTLPAVCPCAAPCKLPSLLLSNLAWLGKGGAGSGIPPSPLSRVKRTLG